MLASDLGSMPRRGGKAPYHILRIKHNVAYKKIKHKVSKRPLYA